MTETENAPTLHAEVKNYQPIHGDFAKANFALYPVKVQTHQVEA